MRPWHGDPTFFDRYADVVLVMKGLGGDERAAQIEATRTAFNRVYRAVAFDVDGTLTQPDGTAIDSEMSEIVGKLLERGVAVFLITGRGRAGVRDAATQIIEKSGLIERKPTGYRRYLRRLRAVTHNGVFLLSSTDDGLRHFLTEEKRLDPVASDDTLKHWHEALRGVLVASGLDILDWEMERDPEPGSIRISFTSDEAREAALPLVEAWKDQQQNPRLHVTKGAYSKLFMLDVGYANKRDALATCAGLLRIDPEAILRLGDQGQDGGNDFDLLDSVAGFSVERYSNRVGVCHPVLGGNLKPLSGVDATSALLDTVYLFAPLSVEPESVRDLHRAMSSFEKLALARAKREASNIERQLYVRIRELLAHDWEEYGESIGMDDLFDQRSGGVRLADWELAELDDLPACMELFNVRGLFRSDDSGACPQRCMFTDTSVLLRGPSYYMSLSRTARDRALLPDYFAATLELLTLSTAAIDELISAAIPDPTVVHIKLVLGVMDNVRDAGLQWLNVALLLVEPPNAGEPADSALARRIAASWSMPHTAAHVAFLLDASTPWSAALVSYRDLLATIREAFDASGREVIEAVQQRAAADDAWCSPLDARKEWFKWREADHFVENLMAVKMGLRRLTRGGSEEPLAVGLAYGGLELPFLATVLGNRQHAPVVPAAARVSVYGREEIGKAVRGGGLDYIPSILEKQGPVVVFDESAPSEGVVVDGRAVMLFDDNCTTAVTLQLARDLLVFQGADVVGSVIVRYPGANRVQHMALPRRGALDVDVVFTFVWGLVGPSPYTRLVVPGTTSATIYEDENGVFDKSKQRIRYLLRKHDPASFPEGVMPTPRALSSGSREGDHAD
jgi:hypothetical protein